MRTKAATRPGCAGQNRSPFALLGGIALAEQGCEYLKNPSPMSGRGPLVLVGERGAGVVGWVGDMRGA